MTEPLDPDLMAMATPYALHAVSESELADVERRLAAAPADVSRAFAEEVRAVRETMAVMSRLAGPPESTILGLGTKVSPTNAAFANGALVHALNYDPIGS